MSIFVPDNRADITSADERKRLLKLFAQEEYGVRPRVCAEKLNYRVCGTKKFRYFLRSKNANAVPQLPYGLLRLDA